MDRWMDIESPNPVSRRVTSRTVLRAILDQGPISRAELARQTGLSRQTMSEVVRDLEDDGWIRETGRVQGSVGRSAVTYEMDFDRAFVFAVDLGGTKIDAAIANLNGDIVCERQQPTDPRGAFHVVDQIVRMRAEMALASGLDDTSIEMAAIGVPGAFDPASGLLAMVPNIAGLENVAIGKELQLRLACPVQLDNDVNMAAKGEQWRGQGSDIDDFVFIAIGTGIGMGIVSDRRIIRGARGAAGEIAALPIGADAFDARVFRSGALESAVGNAAIAARYAGLTDGERVAVVDIFERAVSGDPVALAVIDELARVLAQVVLASSAFVDPRAVIFGGSVGSRQELVDRIGHYLQRCMPAPVRCVASTLGPRAALFGAISTGIERLRSTILGMPWFAHPTPERPGEVRKAAL
jgi:predicted NBD/HSP70 family sugar kinase/biotin operon repressor